MKFPKRWPNRVRKSLTPDEMPGKHAGPQKQPHTTKKSSAPDWRRRWFLPIVAMVLTSGAFAGPALAQNAPSGPVHFPPSTATSATSPPPAPAATPAQSPAPVAPAVSPVQAPVPALTQPSVAISPTTPVITAPQPSSATAEDIHDIRGPISIPYQWLWAAYVATSLLAAAALYAAWRFFRRKAPVRPRLPFEIALERLEAARALMTENRVRKYAFTVSEIIRVYIEQCFGEKAARRTTEEFLSDLLQQTGTPLAQHRRRLEDFLSYCDLMKFARWEASVSEMESMHESARVFVLETRPQPEPAKPLTQATQPNAPAQPELLEAK